jgi:hypothetical protein
VGFALGVSHPPGYPLHSLLMHLSSFLPVGSPAFRGNLFSSLLASLGALLMAANLWVLLQPFYVLKKASPRRWFLLNLACALSAFLLAFSKSYWHEALSAKGGIYILQAVLDMALLLVTQRLVNPSPVDGRGAGSAPPGRPVRWGLLWFFLFALGMGHHWPIQLLLVPASVLMVPRLLGKRGPVPPRKDRAALILKRVSWVLTLCILALSTYLYLPLRAHLHPQPDFGSPCTFHRFMTSVTRADYRRYESRMFGPGDTRGPRPAFRFPSHLREKFLYVTGTLSRQWKPPILLLIAPAAWFFWKRRQFLLPLFLALVFLATAGVTVLYQDISPDDFWVMDGYLLGCNWVETFVLAAGAAFLLIGWGDFASRGRAGGIPRVWAPLSAALACLFLCQGNFQANDQSRERLYHDYGLRILRSLGRGGLYFAETDFDYFPSVYFQAAEKKRLDAVVFLTSLFQKPYLYREVFQEHLLPLDSPDSVSPYDAISRIARCSHRPVYYTFANGIFSDLYLDHLSRFRFFPSGVLLALGVPGTRPTDDRLAVELRDLWEQSLEAEVARKVPENRLLLKTCSHAFFNAAHYLRIRGDLSESAWLEECAEAADPAADRP